MHPRRTTALAAILLSGTAAFTACSTDDAAGTSPSSAPTSSSSTAGAADPAPRIDPYVGMPEVPSFDLTSTDVNTGEEMPTAQRSGLFGIPGGLDTSPELSWSGAPEGTRSYVVTMYDADAVTGSGLWHWMVTDVPATTTELPTGAGSGTLPAGAVAMPGDVGAPRYVGAAPPQGDTSHHYYLTVWALDVASLDVPTTASAAFVGYTMVPHVIGRATLVPVATTV